MNLKGLIIALGGILIFPLILSSQEVNSMSQIINSKGDTIKITPYPLTDINSAIEHLDRQLMAINEELRPNVDLIIYEKEIESSIEYIKSEQLRIQTITNDYSSWQLEDIGNEWNRQKAILKDLQEQVTVKVKWCIETSETIKLEKEKWQLTKALVKSLGETPEMTNRINTILNLVENVEAPLKVRQESVLRMENKITDALLNIDNLRIQLERIKVQIESQILSKDCPVIWKAFNDPLNVVSVGAVLKNNFNRNFKFVQVFFIQSRSQMFIQFLIFSISLLILLFLRTQLHQLSIPLSDSELSPAAYVLSKFIGAALLISLISAGFIYENVPTSVRGFFIMGFIVACSLILPLKLERKYKGYIYLLFMLFLLHGIEFLVDNEMIINRLVILLESILCFMIFFKLFRNKSQLFQFMTGVWWKFVWQMAYLLYAFIISSVIANFLGYFNLAALLTKISFYALLFAIVSSVAQMVLQSSITLLLHTKLFNQSHLISQSRDLIKKRLNTILEFLLVFLWIRVTLSSIGYYQKFIAWLAEILDTHWIIGSSTISLKLILTFIIILVVAKLCSSAAKKILNDEIFPRITLPRGVPGATSMLVSYAIGGVGFYIAISSTGVDLNKFGLIAGALGVGIGFGLQNVVHNFISGLILAFERPVQVGDTIDVGTFTGVVKSIGIRSSLISTFDGSEVIVPNSELISKEVINWTLSNQTRRREIRVGVAYGNHPEKVLDIFRKVVRECPDVLNYPLPLCLFDGFGDNSLNFRVLFWVPVDSALTIQSTLAIAIYDALEEAGIEIPFPQRDVHIKSFERMPDNKESV